MLNRQQARRLGGPSLCSTGENAGLNRRSTGLPLSATSTSGRSETLGAMVTKVWCRERWPVFVVFLCQNCESVRVDRQGLCRSSRAALSDVCTKNFVFRPRPWISSNITWGDVRLTRIRLTRIDGHPKQCFSGRFGTSIFHEAQPWDELLLVHFVVNGF